MKKDGRPRFWVSKAVRTRILKRDCYRCRYCGAYGHGVRLEIDHVKPMSKGGTSEDDNLVVACRDCNIGKGNRDDVIPPALVFERPPKADDEADLAAQLEHEMYDLDALLAESLLPTKGG